MADYKLVELDNMYRDVFRVTIDGTHERYMVARRVSYLSKGAFECDAVALANLRDNYSGDDELFDFQEFECIDIPSGGQYQCQTVENLEYVYIDDMGNECKIDLRSDGTYSILPFDINDVQTDMFNIFIEFDYGDCEYTINENYYYTHQFEEISDKLKQLYEMQNTSVDYDEWFIYINSEDTSIYTFKLPELPDDTAPAYVNDVRIHYIDHSGKTFNVEFI